MAFNFGTHSQYDDASTIADPVIAVAAKAIQLPRNKGAFYQGMGAPQIGIDTIDFEVYSRSKTARAGTTGAWADGVATTNLPIDATSIKGLTVGHVLKIESEVVVVKSANKTANTIDVYARGAAGTTGAAHVNGTAYKVIGYAGKDTELKNVESVFESTGFYTNFVQTVFETLDWETKGALLRRKGLGNNNIISILTQEASFRVAEMLATMAVLGEKQAGSKTGTPYMSAGLYSQLADDAGGTRPVLSYNAAGALTETKLRAALKELTKYGTPTTIWASPTNKEVINTFNSSLSIQIPRTEHTAGQYVDSYDYEGLVLEVKIDSDLDDTKLPIVNMNKCYKSWLKGDNLRLENEPKKSSREMRQSIQGSVGFLIEDVGYEHSYIYGIV